MKRLNTHRSGFIVILSILLLTIIFLGCKKYEAWATFKYSPEWSNELILTFNGHEYNVTDQTTGDVGNKIGTISYHAKIPNSYSLYEIKSSKDSDKIAVKTKKGYLIANIKS